MAAGADLTLMLLHAAVQSRVVPTKMFLLFQFCFCVHTLFMLWSAHVKQAVLLTALYEAWRHVTQ